MTTSAAQMLDVSDLGLTDTQRRQFKHMMDSPGGLILYTGPTGSGKTTKDVRNQITVGAPIADIRAKAIEKGMLEFRKAALLKVPRRQTSIEEVFRMVPSEHLRLHG